jgi:hypothetical protein
MRRISSRMTFFHKRVFPVLFFGFALLTSSVGFITAWHNGQPSTPFALIPLAMIAFVYFLMKKLVFDLADEVLDAGDALVVRNGGQEERIALSDIKNVSYSSLVNPTRVTLTIRRPTVFGDTVSFSPPARFVPFATSPVVRELIDRVDEARRKH